jgi:hypothetical protein
VQPALHQPPPGNSAGQGHVIANTVLSFLAGAAHLLVLMSAVLNALIRAGTLPDLSGASDYELGRVVGYFTGFFWTAGASLVGLIWAPVNGVGMLRKRPWARRSALAYWWVYSVICCCFPIGIYAIWSLYQPSVKAELSKAEAPTLSSL